MAITKERVLEIIGYYVIAGKEKTLEYFDIKEDTLRRYILVAKNDYNLDPDKSATLREIEKKYTPRELQAIARGGRVAPGQSPIPIVSFEGERVRIGYFTDTHYGSIYSNPDYTYQAYEEFMKEKVDFVAHSGDVVEGMSNRPGHIYELSHIGYTAQKNHAKEILEQCPVDMYLIDGNHDRWFVKSTGAYIIQEICNEVPHLHYLGQDEGDISLKGYSTLKLWHGEDGQSYSLSYRAQKIIEAFSGGEKPGALVLGHVHKSFFIFERNVHCYSGGTLEMQSKWMRGKRIAAHVGFWIIDFWVAKSGITKSRGTWYPFYS
jgi:predicted phosphodiesterase